jgi:hypothetical protein
MEAIKGMRSSSMQRCDAGAAGRLGGTGLLLKQVFYGLEEAGGMLTEAAIVVLRLAVLIVPTGGPWGWVFCGRRWLPGSVAFAPPSEGKDGSGQQPEDS